MYYAGIDIGSRGAKAVILKDAKIVSYAIGETGADSAGSAVGVFEKVAKPIGLTLNDMSYIIATGYGRVAVPFSNGNVSEISCHAKGTCSCAPAVRTILDMGGQDCKAINCDENGVVTKFVMNDKCAGGTGRFLEVIADILGLELKEIGPASLQSTEKLPFNTICAVFAKSDAYALLKKGAPKADILAGLHEAIATRAHNLLKRVDIQKDFAITGGIAKNVGMVAKMREKMGMEPVLIKPDPQIAGALGAALFARDRYLAKLEAARAG